MPKRSLKIDGKTTSIFLEDAFWNELEIMAEANNVTWPQMARLLIAGSDVDANRSAYIKEALLIALRDNITKLSNAIECDTSALLVNCNDERERWSFNKSTVILGRGAEVDICINDDEISRMHCAFIQIKDMYYLMDLCSKNGSFVNNLDVSRAALKGGEIVKVGKTELRFIKTKKL